jgi:hypothetical protein
MRERLRKGNKQADFITSIILAVPTIILAHPHPPDYRQPLRPVDRLRAGVGLVF